MPWLPCLTCSEKERFFFSFAPHVTCFSFIQISVVSDMVSLPYKLFYSSYIYLFNTEHKGGGWGVKANKLFVLLSLPFCLVVEKRELFLFFYSSRTATLCVFIYI
jgi:hypothetical protein